MGKRQGLGPREQYSPAGISELHLPLEFGWQPETVEERLQEEIPDSLRGLVEKNRKRQLAVQ